jgi:hypothetical protein
MASLKLIHEVDTHTPIYELSRFNNLIFGYNGEQDILEIDIKHHLLVRNKLKYPPIGVKCCLWEGKMQYFVTMLDRVELYQGSKISETNSKA